MINIYGSFTPHFFKVVMAAEELGLQYKVVPVNLLKQETRTAEHRQRHPFGKAPVIDHDGKYIFESSTIMRYLGNIADSNLYPKAPYARAMVEQWMDYFSFQAGRWVLGIWFQKTANPTYFKKNPDAKLIEENTEMLLRDMPVIEQQLQNHKYLAGSDFTLADVNAYQLMRGYKESGLNFSDYPHFVGWVNTVAKRPSAAKALEYERITAKQ